MTTLHILNAAPAQNAQFNSCLRVVSPGDGILLCGEAVHALRVGSAAQQQLEQRANYQLYALQEDVKARAIDAEQSRVTLVNYPEFVALTVKYTRVNSWA
ncbi:MAG TPA: sulfurtransferase complex subunit TusB [Thiopseudomonas sp.]|nr:sulfurtransferase complex subunit TusB [Thiopseudomonas sp.]